LTASDPAGARRMCILLADFLRNTLSVSGHESIRLADELALADRFLDIEQVRFGNRLKVERRIDTSAADCLVPPLILQPLVENAVTHGIAGMLDGGLIQLDVSRESGFLSIAIENPRDGDARAPNRLGLGLENVRRRLAIMFGNSARLITRSDAEHFRVELELPWSVRSES
jgi:two-component system, LytTR family, sensor histidine kinase AlgZ